MMAFRVVARLGAIIAIAAGSGAAWAQGTPAATSYGPGRIICGSATSCELGIGSPASLKYRIDPSALPDADKNRLTKQCTAKAAPCVGTVTGSETKDVVKAASIKFYN
jgi:hypothetical protein